MPGHLPAPLFPLRVKTVINNETDHPVVTVVFMQAANAAFSQQITIHVENASLRSVLSTIKKQSGYRVLYSTEVLERSVPVTLQLKNATLEQVLAQTFVLQPLTYKVENGTILIGVKPPAPVFTETPLLKEIVVKGTVTSDKGEPIPGAAIIEKGTQNGTATDVKRPVYPSA